MTAPSTTIEWTDATWNPVRGCVKVSPGCANCYAETFAERWRGVPGHPYEQGFDLRLVPSKLDEPLTWKSPRRVFVNSMSDLFQNGVPDEFIDRVFAVMALAPQHTFQVLTKRAERMLAYFEASKDDDGRPARQRIGLTALGLMLDHHPGSQQWDTHNADLGGADGHEGELVTWPLPNVWLGVSVENQRFADERIPLLLQTPAAVRFISAEPLLEYIRIARYVGRGVDSIAGQRHSLRPLDWVIVGGESGAGARPFNVAWARGVVQTCQAAGVPCFVKQLGGHVVDRNDAGFEGDAPYAWPMDTQTQDIGPRRFQGDPVRVRLSKKGGQMDEWPRDLRVREFPKGAL